MELTSAWAATGMRTQWVQPGLPGFLALCERVGFPIEPFQRKIVSAYFAGTRELLVLLPRGNGKSRLIALLALHHLLVTDHPAVYVAASSREQARIVFEYARDAAIELDLDDLIIRHLELRVPGGHLRVLASDAPKLHGLSPTLAVVDELQAAKDDQVYLAMRTALQKRPGARMIVISTAGAGAETTLAKLRKRALAAPDVRRRGALTDARGPSLRMLEWAVDPERSITDTRAAKQANPASWQTVVGLREQRDALPELAYRRYHLNQWTEREGSWLPPGAWAACIGRPTFEPGEKIWAALDVGGVESATALTWINESLQVGCWIETAEDAILRAVERVRELRDAYTLTEFVFDPWRARQAALELERDGILCVELNQSDSRMSPASAGLRAAIVEKRITLPPDAELARHAANAIARHSRRGWRIDSPARGVQVDGVVSLAMALERATLPGPPPTEFLGWL